jgi:NtrC-family two-component system sensor histidine kinase KinB
MRTQSLRTRFILAGCLLVAATVASGVWSVFTFARLSAVAGDALRESQETIDLSATLASALEREDDALLLALTGEARPAEEELRTQRQRFENAYSRLLAVLTAADEQEAARDLRRQADAYREAADTLLASAGRPEALRVYHRRVNPALRKAVADCGRIRELNFRSMQEAGVRARDEARRSTGVVALIALAALAASTLVLVHLARAVIADFDRLDQLRAELVAVASHELKTPLTSLQVNLLLLDERAEGLTPRQREVLAAAILGGQELEATIGELLDLTRIEAGQLRLQRERVDPAAVAEQVVRALRPRFEDAEVGLRVVNEDRGAIVRGDADRLRVVFANLLTNALKYTPRGGAVVVRLASGQDAGVGGKPALQIAVTDTGPGIPPEFRERVFEKFFRVEHHRAGGSEGVRGTGIGLYLCREIIGAHGGTVWCEPGDGGRGTRIAFQLEPEGAEGANGPGSLVPAETYPRESAGQPG